MCHLSAPWSLQIQLKSGEKRQVPGYLNIGLLELRRYPTFKRVFGNQMERSETWAGDGLETGWGHMVQIHQGTGDC